MTETETVDVKKTEIDPTSGRFVLLYLMGIIYYGGIRNGWTDILLLGVLQRLALCYLFTGILFINFKLKGMVVACVAFLLGYRALLSFVPVPEFNEISFAEGKNWANWVDQHFLPLRKWDGDWDPEGLLSTLPAISNCLSVFLPPCR